MAFNLEDLKNRNPVADVAARYTTLHRVGRRLGGPCPLCGGGPRNGRFEVMEDETWSCAVCGKGGDVIKLVELAEDVDFKTAVARLGGAAELDPAQAAKLAAKRERARLAREAAEERRREAERKKLHDGWNRAARPEGTVAQQYLEARGLQLPPSIALRFVEAVPYYNGGARKLHSGPAMVAAFIRRDGKFGGLHQTWLKADGAGKAEIVDADNGELLPAKKMRGQKAGCHIAVAAFGVPRRLFIAEGIETVLSICTAMKLEGRALDDVAFWAAGDLGNLAGRAADTIDHPTLKRPDGKPQRVPNRVPDPQDQGLAIPDGVDELVLLGDGDSDPFLTECAMTRAARRYQREGRRVFIAMAPIGHDFNDALRASGAATVMQIIDGATMADKKADNVANIDDARKANARKAKKKEPKAASAPASDEDEVLRNMNDEFAVVPLAGKVRVMALELSPQYGPDVRLPVYWSFADFKNYHHKLVGSGRSAIGAGAWWLQQQERRQYRGVVYAPNQDVPEFFNLWRGFAIAPAPGYCDLYLQHLLEVICAGNEAHCAYLLDWMAYTIQNPDKPGRTVIVLKGGEGVGKGAAVEPFRRIFGPHFRLADKSSHLVGKFNAHLWCCSFIFADEATFAGDRSIDGALKSLVTSPTLTIEPKGFEQIQVPNCLSVVMASNNDWVVPAGPDARRFFMLVVSSHRRGDDAYFAALRSELENGGVPALLDMLLKRDVSRFDHERDMPATEALEMQKAYSRRGIDALIDYLTDEGALPHAFKHEPWSASTKGALNNPPTGFYEAARKIAPDLRRMSDRTIKRELISNWECEPYRRDGKTGITFPMLSRLRALFSEKNKTQTIWGKPDEWGVENADGDD